MNHYILSGYGYEAQIDANWGADIKYLRFAGQDILYPLDDDDAREKSAFLHGAPLLLPANRTANGSFSFGGKTYQLPINEARSNSHLHGLLYNKPFATLSHSQTQWVGEYVNTGEAYPFPYQIRVSYTLTPRGFVSHYELTNNAPAPMPFTFGLHTTFAASGDAQVPVGMQQERDEWNLPTGRYLPLNQEQLIYRTGVPTQGCRLTGYYTADGDTARIGDYFYQFSGPFSHWILFNGMGDKGFVCIEPQCGEVNGLNGKCMVLDAGTSVVFETTIGKIE